MSNLLDSRAMPRFVFADTQLDSPAAERTAARLDEVIPVLEFAEREASRGSHVALMLSYEAAPAFDPALKVHQPSEFPLAWAAAFDNASNLASEKPVAIDSNSWTPRVNRDEYDRAVAEIRELIAKGDTYQVNYTFPLTAGFDGDAYAWFHSLNLAQGGQYSAYLDLGRYQVLCLSPELFFERCGERVVTPCAVRSETNSAAGRVEWPIV